MTNSVDLSSEAIDELESRLQSGSTLLDAVEATQLRDRAASLLLSEPAQAHRISTLLLEQARLSPADDKLAAIAWRCRAEASIYLGQFDAAARAYETACGRARRAHEMHLYGQLLVGRIGVLTAMGRSLGRARWPTRAEAILRKHDDREYLSKLYMNLGSANFHREEFEAAYSNYQKAAVSMGSHPGNSTWIMLQANLGIACTETSRIKEAREHYLVAEEGGAALGLDHLVAHARFGRAYLEKLRGDYRSALRLLEAASAQFRLLGATELQASTDLANAEIYMDLGMAVEAGQLAESAASLFTDEEKLLDATLSRVVQVRALLAGRRPKAAAQALLPVERFYRAHRIRPRQAAVHLIRAELAMQQKRFPDARRAGRAALRIFEDLRIPYGCARSEIAIVEAELALGRISRAEALLQSALRRRGLPSGIQRRVWGLAGRVSWVRGDRDGALERLRRAARYLERERSLIPGVELRASAFSEQVKIYLDLAEVLAADPTPDLDDLLRLGALAHGQVFHDRATTETSAEHSIEERAELASLVARLEKMEFSGLAGSRKAASLRAGVQRLERTVGQGQRAVSIRQDRATRARSATRTDIQRALGESETLIQYTLLSGAIVAVVLSRGDAAVRSWKIDRRELEELLAQLHHQLDVLAVAGGVAAAAVATTLLGPTRTALQSLFEIVLAPLDDLLSSSSRLLIVSHDLLGRVPFECLHDTTDWVDERWTVQRLPTAVGLGARDRSKSGRSRSGRREWGTGTCLLAGTIAGGPVGVEREIANVQRALESAFHEVEVLRDPSRSVFLDRLAAASLVHVSTHGVFRADNPDFSRLALGDGALFALDVRDHPCPADLVFLSACETGVTSDGAGDDPSGMAHAFLASGARQVVASQWRVDDAATVDLITAFYRVLSLDPDPAVALRSAARTLRSLRPHPFFWGGFCVFGR